MIGATSVQRITDRQARGGRSRVGENQAGIGPLLESRKARDEQRRSGKHVPNTEDDHEVGGVAQALHDADEGWKFQGAHYSADRALGGEN
jgi:hypothetical protein